MATGTDRHHRHHRKLEPLSILCVKMTNYFRDFRHTTEARFGIRPGCEAGSRAEIKVYSFKQSILALIRCNHRRYQYGISWYVTKNCLEAPLANGLRFVHKEATISCSIDSFAATRPTMPCMKTLRYFPFSRVSRSVKESSVWKKVGCGENS